MKNTSKRIADAFELEDWKLARRLLVDELRKMPSDHWLMTRLATTYYEERRYDRALEISERAMKLKPSCPLVRWDYACVLDMLDRTSEAIGQWKRLLKAGPRVIAGDTCGEGVAWANSLVNDCRYRLALAHADVREFPKARRYMREYLRRRKGRVHSIYERKDAEERLAAWTEQLEGAVAK